MVEDLWYKNAIIYSLDLETFMDASGDGIGDFEGLLRRLDYLHSLGVDALWLAPFYPSPNRDNGYDITDFYGVDPRHGSSGDFVAFMHGAKVLEAYIYRWYRLWGLNYAFGTRSVSSSSDGEGSFGAKLRFAESASRYFGP